MTGAEMLEHLARDGVTLYLADGELRARARPGALTTTSRAEIDRHRATIVGALMDEAIIAGTLANLAAEPAAVREAWRREVIAWHRWEAAGGAPDPNQRLDMTALRRLVPPGTCLACDLPMPDEGRDWCACCDRSLVVKERAH